MPARRGRTVRWRRGARPVVVTARRFDPRARVLPDFVVIGAQKAGTSSLYSQLVAHPSVVPALVKEVHHFDFAPRGLGWYRAHFPRRSIMDAVRARTGYACTGEATPIYLFHPGVPARLRAALPEARLVVVLRDPVDRAISAYHHAVRMGLEDRPIDVALDPASAIEASDLPTDLAWWDARRGPLRMRGYLERGRYAEQLERWFALTPREQMLVLESSDLRGGRAPAAVLEFLGLPAEGAAVVADRNVGRYERSPLPCEPALREYFRPHNERLFALLGRRFDWGD